MKRTQIRYISIKNRWFWIAIAGLVLSGWVVQHSKAAELSTDAEKRKTIEKMVAEYRANFPDVVEMDSTRAMDLMKDKKIVFIDVRRPNEQEVSMLPGAIPHNVFLENPEKYNDYTKVGYCTIGYRSSRFTQMMQRKGITIYNLHGGMLGWVHDGGKIYAKNGQSFRIHVYGRPWKLAPEGYQEVW
jgi:rhodanese-related sulfurtransferase